MRCALLREVSVPLDTVLKKIPRELKRHGFQLLSNIRIDKELRESLGVDYKHCAILVISNLQLAYKTLLREEESALLQFLPVLIYEKNGKTALATMRPSQLFPILQSPCREEEAAIIEKKLLQVMDSLCRKTSVGENISDLQAYNSKYKAMA